MNEVAFIATAWNNGQHLPSGAGYGLKLSIRDRDQHFRRSWKTVDIQFSGKPGITRINVDKDSFWSETCRELISKDIGRWLIGLGLAPWQPGQPPKVVVRQNGDRSFNVSVGR